MASKVDSQGNSSKFMKIKPLIQPIVYWKVRIFRPLWVISTVFLLIFQFGSLQAQEKVLHLVHLEKDVEMKIPVGSALKIWLKGEKKPVRGTLRSSSDSSLVIGGEEVPFKSISRLAVLSPLRYLLYLAAVPVAMVGLGWTAFGGLNYLDGWVSDDAIHFVGGQIDMAIGSGILFFSSLAYRWKPRRYFIGVEWSLEKKTPAQK